MKIQFAIPLRDRFGKNIEQPILVPGQEPALKSVTLGDLCCMVLDVQQQSDDAKLKVRRWELIQAITEAEKTFAPLEVLESDVEMMKDRILKSNFNASVCGSAVALLKPVPED